MQLLLRRFAGYGLNTRILTEGDFYNFCRQEGIKVFQDMDFTAYLMIEGSPNICLGRDLSPARKVFAMFHEAAHHFNCAGFGLNEIRFLSASSTSKIEREANNIGIIALCPIGVLRGEIQFDREIANEFGINLFEQRCRIYETYGI
jgi:Zn-dependent peptidase ImmA (M78 family)